MRSKIEEIISKYPYPLEGQDWDNRINDIEKFIKEREEKAFDNAIDSTCAGLTPTGVSYLFFDWEFEDYINSKEYE